MIIFFQQTLLQKIQFIKKALNLFQDKMLNQNQKTAELSISEDSDIKQPIIIKKAVKKKGYERHLYEDEKQSSEDYLKQNRSSSKLKSASSNHFKKNKKIPSKNFNEHILQTISSADKIIKLLLNYNHTELEKDFSVYLLNKEKLIYYLENGQAIHQVSPPPSPAKILLLNKNLPNYTEQTEGIPINHLQRLQRIVYNKIIPLLQTEFQSEKRSLKKHKKNKLLANSQLQDGIKLLQRLQQKQRITIDQCSEILQRFIMKTIEREDKLMKKIQKLQMKLDVEGNNKLEENQKGSKRSQQQSVKVQEQLNKKKKKYSLYEQFSKEVKASFLQFNKIQNNSSQQNYKDMAKQIKKFLINEQKHQKKKCQHKVVKESQQQEEINAFEGQIKNLKQIIKNLDEEIVNLKRQSENIEEKYNSGHQKVQKLQQKELKIVVELQDLNKKNDQYIEEIHYKNKLIENYLEIISKFQQDTKERQFIIFHSKEQNLHYQYLLSRNTEEKQQYLNHIIRNEQKIREEETLLQNKQRQFQSLFQEMNIKLKQFSEFEGKYKLLLQENIQLKSDLIIKNAVIQEYKTVKHYKEVPLQEKDSWRDQSGSIKYKAFIADELIIDGPSSKNTNEIKSFNGPILQKEDDNFHKLNEQIKNLQMQPEASKHSVIQKLQSSMPAEIIDEVVDSDQNAYKKKHERQDYCPGAIDEEQLDNVKEFYLIVEKRGSREDKLVVLKQEQHEILQEGNQNRRNKGESAQKIVERNDEEQYGNMKKQERPDFVPGAIDFQQIQKLRKESQKEKEIALEGTSQKIVQRNDGNYNENKKKQERPDFVPGAIDMQQIQKLKNAYLKITQQQQKQFSPQQKPQSNKKAEILIQQIPQNPTTLNSKQQPHNQIQNLQGKTLNQDILQLQYNTNVFNPDFKYIQNHNESHQRSMHHEIIINQSNKPLEDYLQNTKSKSQHHSILEHEDQNVENLLKTYKIINQKIIYIQNHIKNCQNYPEQIRICKEELQVILKFLNNSKENVLKQYKIIKISQDLRRRADEQVLRLKHCFNDAFLQNINESSIIMAYNITQEKPYQDGFKMIVESTSRKNNQNILQELQKAIDRLDSNQSNNEMRKSKNKNVEIQLLQKQFQNLSPVLKNPQQIVNKSFLDLMQNFNYTKKTQNDVLTIDLIEIINRQEQTINKDDVIRNSKQNNDDKNNNRVSEDKNVQTNEQQMKDVELDSIGSMIKYHKEQILNLHHLLRVHTTQFIDNKVEEGGNQHFSTPLRPSLLDKQEYVDQILKAPQKQQKQSSQDHQKKDMQYKVHNDQLKKQIQQKQFQMEELKNLMNQRQFELNELIRQKQQQIERLKSIINTLTNIQLKQERPRSVANSRNKEEMDFQKDKLKRENQELRMNEEAFRMEIERLQIKIKNSELSEQLLKAKITKQNSIKKQALELQSENRDKNLSIRSELMSGSSMQIMDSEKMSLVDKEEGRQAQHSNIDGESPSKRNKIVRKGKSTKHKAALFTIEDLLPEYYGKKQR